MSLGQELAPHLPFLRRYARALTGSQAHGDAFVRATLEAIVAKPDEFPRDVDPRLGLYRTFHAIWSTANIEEARSRRPADGPEGIAQARLSRITPLVAPGAAADLARRLFVGGHRLSDRRSPDDVDSLVAEALEPRSSGRPSPTC
jgi:DNA-directed RNA polymerase specialized sigma24 family protein